MEKLATALLLLTLSAGCAFDTKSVGSGNGGLDGNDPGPGAADAGVDTTSPDTTVPSLSTPNTLDPNDPSKVPIVEPTCTPATERSSCPGTSCDPAAFTCTTLMLASRSTCETCFTDSNCARMDHRCVHMTYQGEPFPDKRTGFCLQIAEPLTVDGSYACEPPFAVPLVNRVSTSGGKNQSYCGIHEKLTTCFALLAFHNGETCPTGRDDECPTGGLCRALAIGGRKTEYACTYGCTDVPECSTSVAKVDCAGFCGG